jgi:predicted permease
VHLGHDLRLVLRGFRQTPAPAILIVLTLGLAIGANSATFSLIDRVALRPLPVEKPYEIVMVNALGLPYHLPGGSVISNAGKVRGMPYPLFQSLRAGLTRSFTAMAAFRGFRLTVSAEPTALEILGEGVTADYFRVLGLHPLVGRTFTPAEEGQRDGAAIAILNHGFWLRQFGGDRAILNRTIRLNNVPFTVVGVLAPGYSGMFTWSRPDVFVPVALGDQLRPPPQVSPAWSWDGLSNGSYFAIARLAPGVARDAAERDLRVYYQRLWDDVVASRHVTLTAKDMDVYRRRAPEVLPAGTVGSTESGTPHSYEVPLRLLFAMTVFVLLVAAANVANLLAASGARRGHEMAVSLALGARRWDLLRPRLVEALALTIVSGAAALLLAEWTGNLVPSLLGLGEDLAGIDTRPDARVVVFTAGMSVLTGLLIWLASALLVTRRAALPSLVAGRADASGRRPGAMLRRGLVVVQVALSLALVCTAVLFGRSLANVLSVDPGFDADHVVGFTVNPRAVGYDGDRLESYVQALVNRARALPGVSRVAVSSVMPLSGGGCCTEVSGPRQQAGHAGTQYAGTVGVSPDYFATIGLGFVTGRSFDERDVTTAPRVVTANEAAARLLVDSPEVIGQRIGFAGGPASLQIVGVVRDSRSGLKTPAEPTLYLPRAQMSGAGPISVLLRVPRAETVSAATVTEIVRRLDRGVALTAFGSLGTLARDALLRDRMLAGLSQVFAALAGLLAAMGLAGLTSVNVTRRTREIGIRLALGASRGSVQRLMLREVAVLIGAGTAAGLVLFLSANRVLRSMLFEISADDPVTIALAIAALAAIGLLAGLLPARRAAYVDPAVTLRCE